MTSERDHTEELGGRPGSTRGRPVRAEAAAGPDLSAPAPLASAVGNAAFTQLVRGQARAAVQRSALLSQGAGPLDGDIAEAIRGQVGGGSPLPPPVRSEMESHLGYDLSPVRVHTGAAADTLNTAVQAEAFTAGTDVFFSPGAFDPRTPAGKELLAHELTHVVQQSTGTAGEPGQVSSPSDPAEVAASAAARDIVSRCADDDHE